MAAPIDRAQLVIDQLALSAGILMEGKAVVPRYRLQGQKGPVTLFTQFPPVQEAAQQAWELVGAVIAHQRAVSFTMASEIIQPPLLLACHVTRMSCTIGVREIRAAAPVVDLGAVQWLEDSAIGDDPRALFPAPEQQLDPEMQTALDLTFAQFRPDEEPILAVNFNHEGRYQMEMGSVTKPTAH